MPELTVQDIAARVGGAVDAGGELRIRGIAGIRDAQAGELSFVSNPRYASEAAATKASAVLVPLAWDKPCPAALIRVENPDAAFAAVAVAFAPAPIRRAPGVHPTAVIAPDAVLGSGVSIGPYCVIEPGANIGADTVLDAQVYVGHEAEIGPDSRLYPQVSLRERVRIGARCILHNGVVLGSDGFGYTVNADGVRTKIPQFGTVVVGDDVEIGANTTVDRARFGKTLIGNGVKIDNLVQIAHNVVIGDHAVIVAQVGIAGSTTIGSRAVLAGQAGVAGHLVIGAGAIVGAQAGVTKSVPPGAFVSGYPAAPHEKATRIHAHLMRLPEMRAELAELRGRIQRLEAERKHP